MKKRNGPIANHLFPGQETYEKFMEANGLDPEMSAGDFLKIAWGKIKTLGATIRETMAKLLKAFKGLTERTAQNLADLLHGKGDLSKMRGGVGENHGAKPWSDERPANVTPRETMKAKVQDAVPNQGIDDPMAKAVRAETYKSGDVTPDSTPAEVEQATGEAWTRTMTNRKSELGAVNLGDVADAMQGIVKKLYPEAKPDKPPTQEQIIQKARELAKKRAVPIDLNKVDLNEGINKYLAYWDTLAGGAGIDADGIPIIGGPVFPSEAPALPSRDATKFETFMRGIDNPAGIMEGGIDSFQDPMFGLGQSPVAEAAFANIRKGTLKLNLTEWRNNLLANTVNCTRESEAAIKPIFERYGILRGQQQPLQDQIQPALRYRSKEATLKGENEFVAKLKHEQANDLEPRRGVVGENEIEAWQKRTKSREDRIKKAEARAKKTQDQIEQIVEEDRKGKNVLNDPKTAERLKRHDEIEAKLETERGNLDKATEALGRKYARVRVGVAASLGAEKQNYPDWLKETLTPHDQKIAEAVRKFFDESALPALKDLKIPVRENENFLHQPNRRYLGGGETTWAGVPERPQSYKEPQFDPTSIHFSHAEDNPLLWYPEIGGILDSYTDVFSGVVSKRELANRWEPAIEEMRAQGQLKAASMTEKFLNAYAHGEKRVSWLDSITAWFYYKNLALNPSPALLHASKQLLNPSALGVEATAMAYKDAAAMVVGGTESARLASKATRTWRASQGAKSIMAVESGVEPTARAKMLRDAYGFSASAPIGQVEVIDRNVTFLGSMELAKQMGLPPDQAIQVAMGTTMAINFLGVDRAPIYQGSVGNAIFAFMGAPTKLADYGRRQANNTIRAMIAGAKPDPVTGKRKGFNRKAGGVRPEVGKGGEHYRNLQRTALYATTIAMAGLVDEYFNTHKIQAGLIHIPKMYKMIIAMAKGDKEGIYGGAADLAPAVTQFMDDLDAYGWGMPLMMNAVLPTVANKAWVAWYNDGAPSKGQQWGDAAPERSARYLLNAPKADAMGEKKERRGFQKEKKQNKKSSQWLREHGMD